MPSFQTPLLPPLLLQSLQWGNEQLKEMSGKVLWLVHNSISLPLLSSHTSPLLWHGLSTGCISFMKYPTAPACCYVNTVSGAMEHLLPLLLWPWCSYCCFSFFFFPPFLLCVSSGFCPVLSMFSQRHHWLCRLAQLWLALGLLLSQLEPAMSSTG